MMDVIKNNFWFNTLVYAVGFLFLRGISFFLLPIYTNLLSTNDAGIVFLIYTVLAFLNPLYSYGMNASLFKYFNNTDFDKKNIISTSFISLFVSSFVFSVCIIIFSKYLNFLIVSNSTVLINWFGLIACILFFDSISSRSFVVLRMLEKPVYFLFIGVVNICCSLVFNYIFIGYYSLGSFGAVVSILFVSIIQFFCLVPSFITLINLKSFNLNLFYQMFGFAKPFLPSALLFVVVGFSDRWLIKYFLDLHSVGIYGAGYKIGSIMSLVVTAFNLNWQPYYLKQKDIKNNDFGKIGNWFILGLIYILTMLVFLSNIIITINYNGNYLIGKEFWSCVSVVPFVALGYLFYGVFILQMPSIYLLNKQRWVLVFWVVGAVVNVVGNIILIPWLGILGAAISTSFAYFVMMVFIVFKNRLWLPIKYSFKSLGFFVFFSFFVLFSRFFDFGLVFLLVIVFLYTSLFFVVSFKFIKK